MNRTVKILMVVSIVSILIGSNSTAFGVIDFEIEPHLSEEGYGMGFAYFCGVEYNYAAGLTLFTISWVNATYVSQLGYYDADYDLTQMYENVGIVDVLGSAQQYWEDKQLSEVC